MNANTIMQVLIFLAVLIGCAIPLGSYMARVYRGEAYVIQKMLSPIERAIYRLSGIQPNSEWNWKYYGLAVLLFNFMGIVVVYFLQCLQNFLPLNPMHFPAVSSTIALNTAISFVTNTNWQAYSGEASLSYLTQMLGLTVQNFLSAATGMAVLVAFIRGFTRQTTQVIGNFWVDLTRSTLYILLPLSLVFAVVLVSQGVVQTFDKPIVAQTVEGSEQKIAIGPVASQVAIKQLGTNGGGYFNANSAHPFENPTPLTNFLEILAILLIPAALCFTFGQLIQDKRQGWALFSAMLVLFVPLLLMTIYAEQAGNPLIGMAQPNMEGKEVRFGIIGSTLWAAATTAASNGSVNAMHDSFMPLGSLAPMWLMQLGEIIFGGVGSGLYGMLVYAIVAVFIAGLMVGRTPEYLGKKIEAHEIKMAALVILLPSAAVLIGTAIACVVPAGTSPLGNAGAHGFSEILYAFSSGANNNGSAFGGLTVNGFFYTTAMSLCMLIGRFLIIVPILAMAGSLAKKKIIPQTVGTLPTHQPLFIVLLIGTIILVGALTFIPALVLGPIAEHLQLHRGLLP